MTQEIKRIVPLEEVLAHGQYDEMAELAVIFNHEIIEDIHGVWRWKANKLMETFLNGVGVYTPSNKECDEQGLRPYCRPHTKELEASINLNWISLHREALFTTEEWMKFNMQTGYSLSGYYEITHQCNAYELNLPGAKTKPLKTNGGWAETLLQYMLRIHKGKVLKL